MARGRHTCRGCGIGDLTLELARETLIAMPERSLWWKATRTLVLSDLHLGKDEGLRTSGAIVPEGPMHTDLDRLSRAIQRTQPDRVVIVGDLVHGRLGLTDHVIDAVGVWRSSTDAPIVLVPGNHESHVRDTRLAQALDAWRIERVEGGLNIGPIALVHDPDHAAGPSICGHLHPVVCVGRHRAPAFVRTGGVLVLPAFSAFTGGAAIEPRAHDDVLVCADDDVLRVYSSSPAAD